HGGGDGSGGPVGPTGGVDNGIGGGPSINDSSIPLLALPSFSGSGLPTSLHSASPDGTNPLLQSNAINSLQTNTINSTTANHRTPALSIPSNAPSLPNSTSFNQPLIANTGSTRDMRSTPEPSPWQGFQPPLPTAISQDLSATSTVGSGASSGPAVS